MTKSLSKSGFGWLLLGAAGAAALVWAFSLPVAQESEYEDDEDPTAARIDAALKK